ncbi:MAG: 3-dehydroquinate synthase [SAR202 cluster bacterium]|nr:3-dehydroquinate synthase [SAR202 cluster bacterium]
MVTKPDKQRIFLIGFSGTGKTSAGRVIAAILGWQFYDVDEIIVSKFMKPIEQIFADHGEETFRKEEEECIKELSGTHNSVVVSTGAGAVSSLDSIYLMQNSGFVINFDASPEIIAKRLSGIQNKEGGEAMARPMLLSDDPIGRIKELKSQRQFRYASAHWSVHTDQLSISQVANESVRAWRKFGNYSRFQIDPNVTAVVNADSGTYPIIVGWDILETQLGSHVHELGITGRAHIICDSNVVHPYGRAAQRSLHSAGIEMTLFTFPAGELNKNLKTVESIYEWLANQHAERGDVVVAVGGGVVGDVAGYVAATLLRGIKLIHVPTSLTAMVDSSIGGKTGVDLVSGKNLVGAFHQPSLVLTDVSALKTLPRRALMEGWAEAIKHGFVFDEFLVSTYEEKIDQLVALDPEITTSVVSRNIEIKSNVVTNDEKETYGLRQLLNYGHTIGHAIETAAGYGGYLHGEAVSIGMIGAAKLGQAISVTPPEVVLRLTELLKKFGLPVHFQQIRTEDILDAMSRDKKMSSGLISWIFLEKTGRATTYRGVKNSDLLHVLEDISKA